LAPGLVSLRGTTATAPSPQHTSQQSNVGVGTAQLTEEVSRSITFVFYQFSVWNELAAPAVCCSSEWIIRTKSQFSSSW
jgi:hypothetical protein